MGGAQVDARGVRGSAVPGTSSPRPASSRPASSRSRARRACGRSATEMSLRLLRTEKSRFAHLSQAKHQSRSGTTTTALGRNSDTARHPEQMRLRIQRLRQQLLAIEQTLAEQDPSVVPSDGRERFGGEQPTPPLGTRSSESGIRTADVPFRQLSAESSWSPRPSAPIPGWRTTGVCLPDGVQSAYTHVRRPGKGHRIDADATSAAVGPGRTPFRSRNAYRLARLRSPNVSRRSAAVSSCIEGGAFQSPSL